MKGFASLLHSASTANFIGISTDITTENKLSSSSQKLIIELMHFAHNISTQKNPSSIDIELFRVLESDY
jgi:hypothetical protein